MPVHTCQQLTRVLRVGKILSTNSKTSVKTVQKGSFSRRVRCVEKMVVGRKTRRPKGCVNSTRHMGFQDPRLVKPSALQIKIDHFTERHRFYLDLLRNEQHLTNVTICYINSQMNKLREYLSIYLTLKKAGNIVDCSPLFHQWNQSHNNLKYNKRLHPPPLPSLF